MTFLKASAELLMNTESKYMHGAKTSFIGTPGGYLVELMKDKRCVDRNGKDNYPCGYGNFVFLNPNDRECRDLVLGVYKELVTKDDLDGLHLDYIRFSEPNPDNGDFRI